MEDLSLYYDDLICEVLDLITFHRQCLINAELSGKPDPERKQKLDLLEKLKEQAGKRAEVNKTLADMKKEDETSLMPCRVKAECPDCKKVMPVKITGEVRNEEIGVMCDWVKCTVCMGEFMNPMPNNWNDRKIFFDFIITSFGKLIEEETKRSKGKADLKELISIVEDTKRYKNAQLEVEKREAELKLAAYKSEQALVGIRDYLLDAKLKGIKPNDIGSFMN